MLRTARLFFVLSVFSVFSLGVHSQTPACPVRPPRRDASNCTDCVPGLDLSIDCSTCEGAESIGCVDGNQDCSVGDFTFSALFHSYENPNSMCGECEDTGPITCELATINNANMTNGNTDCGLRFLYCLRAHGSPAVNVPLLPQPPLPGADNVAFDEGFIIQSNTNGLWNRSNPFTRNFQLWPGRAQFYIVVYHFCFGCLIGEVVDRLLIDLELNISSDFTERKTYHGNLSIAQFDLSFRIDGQCSENYYGPQCNISCSGVEGQFTCDSEGSIVCVNSSRSPESRCTECLAVDGDPDNNCGDTTTTTSNTDAISNTDTTSNIDTTSASTSGVSTALIGGVVGGIIGGVLLLILVILLLCCIMMCMSRARGKEASYAVADVEGEEGEEKVETAQPKEPHQFVNPVYGTEEDVAKAGQEIDPSATELPEYSTIGTKQAEEHDFDNPIYGDEIASNVYSRTTHEGPPHADQPQGAVDDATYSHTTHTVEIASVVASEPSDGVYSQTSHPATVMSPGEHPLASTLSEYDTINLPHYKTPPTKHNVMLDMDSTLYEQPDLQPASNAAGSFPAIYNELENSGALYDELEEREYSTLEDTEHTYSALNHD